MNKTCFALLLVMAMLLVAPAAFAEKTCIYEFQSSGCPHCARLKDFIEDIKGDYDIEVHYIDASREPQLFARLLREYNVPMEQWGYVPTVFVGDYYCIGDNPCIRNIEQKIIENEGAECPGNGDDFANNQTVLVPDIDLTIPGITGLALVDAVNPCALAVLTILLSAILLRDPSKKKKALHAGLAFSIAVFLCYFMIGLLIIIGLKWLMEATRLSTGWLYTAFGVFAIIIGALNIKDYFRYGGGGFVMEVPMRWRPTMKKFIKSVTSVRGAFLVGIIVSLFLLPCTSGPYFVAGGILAGIELAKAAPWLAYYNALFIAPMIVITFVVYGGLTAVEDVSGWRERNIRRLHFVAGIILLGLGIAMVAGLV